MTTTSCKYQIGQAVETSEIDFKAAGMPRAWVSGVVESVKVLNETRRLFDVKVRTSAGHISAQVVGPRGGNQRIRAVV